MNAKVAINGLGRIGRAILKLAIDEPSIEVVAVNDLVDVENLAYLLRFDTVYGRYPEPVTADGGELVPDLRKWFGHDPAKWRQFKQRYWQELKDRKDDVDALRRKAREGKVTFIYAAHDEEHNAALALKEFIERRGS